MKFILPLLLLLVACGSDTEPIVVSNIPEPANPLRQEYLVKLTFCDSAKNDTVVNIIVSDGVAPSSADISTFKEPFPVYRGANFAFMNICGLEVIGVQSVQAIEGSDMILSKDSITIQ